MYRVYKTCRKITIVGSTTICFCTERCLIIVAIEVKYVFHTRIQGRRVAGARPDQPSAPPDTATAPPPLKVDGAP